MSELEIPERAVIRAYDGAHLIEEALRLAAPIIVAAELRRQIDFVLSLSSRAVALPSVIAGEFMHRADELDPEGATR